MKMRLSLAIASIAILAVHGFVFYQQFFHKWENYQQSYFDQAKTLAKNDAEKEAFAGRSPKIEQIMVTQFGNERVDRCTTCHIASDDPRFLGAPHPYKTHPYSEALGDKQVDGRWERRHKFSDMGCTVCHDGQGRGLTEFYAHGEDEFWNDPLTGYVTQENWRADFKDKLKGKEYMEANCAQCHTEKNFKSTPTVNKGRELFQAKNCYGCHKIEGISNGTLGPELTDVGKKWKIDYIYESIVDPRANSATSFMPKFNLTEEEIKSLAIFLKSRRGFNYAETTLDRYRATLKKPTSNSAIVQPTDGTQPVAVNTDTSAAHGQQLFTERACAACHKMGEMDGGIAPDLSFEGLMKEEPWLIAHFKNPRSVVPDSNMPSFGFPEPEFKALSAYLLAQNKVPSLNSGQEIYQNLCMRCHGEKGDGHGQIATYLDPYPRDFTNAGFMNSKTEERLMTSIKTGVPGTSMPAWAKVLNDQQVKSVLDYINQNFTKEARTEIKQRDVPEQNPIPMTDESIARGESIYLQRCTGCHGRKADGKGPNSLDIVPRPRNLLNSEFVTKTNDRRLFESILYGVQGTAMPPWMDYGLSKEDVGDLVNYIRNLNKNKQGLVAANYYISSH
ncbi:MAG TPA: c-type cytochrome [Pyrinomonadaceae bacterium]|nr:c-type cytochrome [Pyrinomonadaceae bacterium]